MQAQHFGPAALGVLILSLALLFVYPAILMLIGRSVLKFRPGYWRCFGAIILAAILGGIIGYFLKGAVSYLGGVLIGALISFVLVTLLMRAFIRQPEGGPLDWGKTALTVLIYVVIVTVIGQGYAAMVHRMQATGEFPTAPTAAPAPAQSSAPAATPAPAQTAAPAPAHTANPAAAGS